MHLLPVNVGADRPGTGLGRWYSGVHPGLACATVEKVHSGIVRDLRATIRHRCISRLQERSHGLADTQLARLASHGGVASPYEAPSVPATLDTFRAPYSEEFP